MNFLNLSMLLLLTTISGLLAAKKVFRRNECPGSGGGAAGGVLALPGEFPYMFAIGWKSQQNGSDYNYRCGGAMFHTEFVLTAAHCLYGSDDLPVVVRAAGDGLKNDSKVIIIEIVEIIEHPEYEYPSTYHDIAILRLAPNDRHQFAVLPDGNAHLNENLTAIGYGDTKFGGSPSEHLLKVYLFVVSREDCSKHYEADASSLHKGIAKTQLCAGDPKKIMDTCQGDSGGPLVRIQLGKHFIMGVTSFGVGCANGPPGVYTNVREYLGWIESVVRPWYNEEFPYMYGLHWINQTSCRLMTETCGAVLISWNYMLMSAHCLYEFDEFPLFYRQGGYNLKYTDRLLVNNDDIVIHPNYSHPAPYNDIALIKMFGYQFYSVTPLWLKDSLPNNTLTYVNYGETARDQFKRQDLLKTSLTYVPNKLCEQIYKGNNFAGNFSHGIDATHLCANDTQQLWDSGQGYADGPLIMHIDVEGVRSPYLVGIASFSVNCEGCPPAVFTRISKYIDWIEEIVWPKNVTNSTMYYF